MVSWGAWAAQTAQTKFLVASWRGKEPLEHWVQGNSMRLLHGEWRWAGGERGEVKRNHVQGSACRRADLWMVKNCSCEVKKGKKPNHTISVANHQQQRSRLSCIEKTSSQCGRGKRKGCRGRESASITGEIGARRGRQESSPGIKVQVSSAK